MRKVTVIANKDGRVLKIADGLIADCSYSALSGALRKKDVLVNGTRIRDNVLVREGDEICLFLSDKKPFEPKIVYEDDNLLVLDKPKNIEVCDGDNNLVVALGEIGRSVIAVHRLDRNTEGLVIFAKTEAAERELRRGFGLGGAKKRYIAEVYGVPSKNSGVFTDYMVKNAAKSEVKVYSQPVSAGEKAVTEYELLRSGGGTSLLSVTISEGKTHQIRASLAYHGLPIIGDGKYGKNEINRKFKASSQRLKCYCVEFSFDGSNDLSYLNDLSIKIQPKF